LGIVSTVLFSQPHKSIASLIRSRLAAASAVHIVAGFATPDGIAAIDGPLRANTSRLKTLVLGAATYPAMQALDRLIEAGVPQSNLYIHMGHTAPTGWPRKPFVKYHPMMHSKIYYLEFGSGAACAFVGSHNITAFALGGLNGEASIMLEGDATDKQFVEIRQHIEAAKNEATLYTPSFKDAYAWWWKQYFAGLESEFNVSQGWSVVRTILIFAIADGGARPRVGNQIYFELPSGIQIESLKTEVHLFLFDALPANPSEALARRNAAKAKFTCQTLGADNEQGNFEVRVQWTIEGRPHPALKPVPTGRHRPNTLPDMQQVRAKVESTTVKAWEYAFEQEKLEWEPVFSSTDELPLRLEFEEDQSPSHIAIYSRQPEAWRRVTGLSQRIGLPMDGDQAALALARPDSGAFVLVALRRRRSDGPS
jgi:hypothetical protein